MAGQATFSLDEDDLDEAIDSDFFADFSAEPLLDAESVDAVDEPESLDCFSFFSDFSDFSDFSLATEEDPFRLSVR
jgi:hypothetical protein